MKHFLSFALLLSTAFPAFTQATNNAVSVFADTVESEYPGGVDAWIRYLNRKISTRPALRNNCPPGKYVVIAQFEVAPDGTVEKVEALSKIGYGMEEMLVKVIQKSKRWKPATINGKPVRSYKKQPIVFGVIDDDRPQKEKKQPTDS